MAEQLSRRDLYELVWSEPMRTLATRFGISDVALKKACAKAEIPVPPRGHWAKKQAGKRTTQPPLPVRPPGMDDDLTVGRGSHHGYHYLSEEEILGPVPDPPVFDEAIEAVRERVRRQIGKVSVPRPFPCTPRDHATVAGG